MGLSKTSEDGTLFHSRPLRVGDGCGAPKHLFITANRRDFFKSQNQKSSIYKEYNLLSSLQSRRKLDVAAEFKSADLDGAPEALGASAKEATDVRVSLEHLAPPLSYPTAIATFECWASLFYGEAQLSSVTQQPGFL